MDIPQISSPRRATFENDNTWDRAAHGVQLVYFARLWLVVTLFKDGHLVKDVENL